MAILDKLERQLRGIVTRAVVNLAQSSGLYQVLWLDNRVSSDVEHLEPQGVHFKAPTDAVGALLAPSGNVSASVLVCAGGETPSDSLEPGEGGLHYLGVYRVFCKADGTTLIGESATLSAAVAELVDARFAALVTVFNAHVHTGVTTGPGSSGPPGTPLAPQASVASATVKVSG